MNQQTKPSSVKENNNLVGYPNLMKTQTKPNNHSLKGQTRNTVASTHLEQKTAPEDTSNYEEELEKEIERLEVKYERKPTKTTKALLQAQLLGCQKAKEEIIGKINDILNNISNHFNFSKKDVKVIADIRDFHLNSLECGE